MDVLDASKKLFADNLYTNDCWSIIARFHG